MSQLTDNSTLVAADRGPSPGARDRAVAVYVLLSLLLLVPGLLAVARIGLDETTAPGLWLAALDREMAHIAFGHTPRFWMGVAGATLMGLLLLYPLRKMFGIGRWISVAAWFHIHTVFGLLGPVLILYHCYFGTGSTPANVALFTTIAVAVSGIFGHFIYARLSAGFHGEKKRAQDHLLDAKTELQRLSSTPSRAKLFDALDNFEREHASRARGVLRRSARQHRDQIVQQALWLLANQGPQEGWSPARVAETAGRINESLDAYFEGLAQAARRSASERLAGWWRLLHLPLFYVTVTATLIHVYKVWDMDAPPAAVLEASAEAGDAVAGATAEGRVAGASDALADTRSATADGSPTAAPRQAPFATRKVVTKDMPAGEIAAATAATPKAVPAAKVASVPAKAPPAPPKPQAKAAAAPTLVEPPQLVEMPRPAQRPSSPPRTGAPIDEPPMALGGATTLAAPGQPGGLPAGDAASIVAATDTEQRPAKSSPPAPLAVSPADPKPRPTVVAKAPPPRAAPEAKPRAAEPDPVAELAKKTEKWDNAGRLDPATVRERLAQLKKDPTFNHDQTRFPLTGKHKRVACESCHKTTLKDTPKRCIDCHKKDDVHRGRRPNCESCHVTTNWGTIKRR